MKRVQEGGFGVMFWACFTKSGLGPLMALNDNLNSEKYLDLLKNNRLPLLRNSDTTFSFMHGSGKRHRFKIA